VAVQIPLIRGVIVQLVAAFLERIGAPVEPLFERVKLSPRTRECPESLVTFSAVARLLEEAARTQGIEDLGLRIGAASQPQQLGVFGLLIGQSLTVNDALATAHRSVSSFNSGARTWVSREGPHAQLHNRVAGIDDHCRQAVALSLMVHLNLIRSAAGPAWRPIEVALPARDVPGCRDLPFLADTPIVFESPEMHITFAADVLSLPLRHTPRDSPAVASWEQSRPATDVGGALQQLVETLLADGYPDIHLVAEAVQMSPRTLQRRLHEEGLTFARVVTRARFGAALRMLADPDRKVIDVALDLGYSDPAHFTRAFSRWTGVTPRDFRRLGSADRQQLVAP